MSLHQPAQPVSSAAPVLKTGLGLRRPHYAEVLATRPDVGFFEVHPENFFEPYSEARTYLDKIAKHYPISLHGVGLSLGSAHGLDLAHVYKVKALAQRYDALYVSEHISFNAAPNTHVPDLLPLPYTQEALETICHNIEVFQNELGHQILVENPSAYLQFKHADYSEAAFLAELSARTGCGLLLDANNLIVSAHNLGLNVSDYLKTLPQGAVKEIHLAGYHINTLENGHEVWVDAHNNPVYPATWQLYEKILAHFGDVNTLIEWDKDIPPLQILLDEAHTANSLRQTATSEKRAKRRHVA
jgi:hypothetical protein